MQGTLKCSVESHFGVDSKSGISFFRSFIGMLFLTSPAHTCSWGLCIHSSL